ncbi:hypothetical protein [Paraburkholderia lycopersici]|uniref:Uncharacterized protein n=1 Tax=Paraburkholderia lycopersici TaxID=416944 RepID=A0A1G6Q0M5_9BURK|nr:hypothetical protein SAMN05421548_11142 [Paraburkholderia lycopersici]
MLKRQINLYGRRAIGLLTTALPCLCACKQQAANGKYDRIAGDLWAVFLPGDRVRIMVADGKEGENDPDMRAPDNDPYIAQGVPDEEWNRLYRDGGNTQ